MAQNNNSQYLIILAVIAVVGLGGYYVMNVREDRSTSEKIGDAVEELPNGLDNAARELEDRTPAEKMGDAVEDATD